MERMKWRWGKKRQSDRSSVEHAAREFLDPYTDVTFMKGPENDVVMQPGKMLDKLRERMERLVLDPESDVEFGLEDFLSFDESMMLIGSGLGFTLVSVTAEHAADLLAREFPPELATLPIQTFHFADHGMTIPVEVDALAREVMNGQTGQPRRDLSDYADQIGDLTADDQAALYLAVLVLYIFKLQALVRMVGEA